MPSEPLIHPTAIVGKGTKLGADVEIGPYCIVGDNVTLGDGVRLISHVSIDGITTVGANSIMYPFASIGQPPQDLKYKGEPSRLEIGRRCMIREYVTMNTGTEGGGMLTKVGDDCLFMAGSHVAHDCILGNNVILANNATLGGHVVVGDYALFGGLSAVRQFIRIGTSAMIGGMSGVEHDVIPYGLVMGDRARLSGLNLIGIERRGFSRPEIQSMRTAYRMLFGPEGTFAERTDEVARTFADNPHVTGMIDFIRQKSKVGICQPESLAN